MTKSQEDRVFGLRTALEAWIEEHDLAIDTFFKVPSASEENESGPDLIVYFEGDLHPVLWVRPMEDRPNGTSTRLRSEFNEIVKQHGFNFCFKNETTGHFYMT